MRTLLLRGVTQLHEEDEEDDEASEGSAQLSPGTLSAL